MNRRHIFIAFIVLVLLIVGGLILFFTLKNRTDEDYLTLFGNVDVRQVELGFRVPGRVEKMQFEEGDHVEKNVLMANLEKEPYGDQLKQAKASLESAKASYAVSEELLERRRKLLPHGGVSKEDYENSLSTKNIDFANYEEKQASLGVAETNLRDTEIFSPAEGTILTRVREPGTVVNVGDPIYTLSVISPVWIRAYVSERELGLIYPGMKAQIFTDTDELKMYEGHVGFISPVAEFTPKTVETTQLRTDLVYRIRIIADNPDKFLKQGMPVTARLALKKNENR